MSFFRAIALCSIAVASADLALPVIAQADDRWIGSQTLPAPESLEQRLLNPSISLNSRGDAVALWKRQYEQGFNHRLELSLRKAGSNWGEVEQIPGAAADFIFPEVVIDDHGIVTAVWEQFSNDEGSVMLAARRDRSGHWSGPVTISSGVNAVSSPPMVDSDGRGQVHVVWQETINGNEGRQGIYYASADTGGSWRQPKSLSSGQYNSEYARIDANESGDLVVVWMRSVLDQAGQAIESIYMSRSGNWSGRTVIHEAEDGESLSTPDIGLDGQGRAVAVWGSASDRVSSARATKRESGIDGGWSDQEKLSQPFEGKVSSARVSVNSIGSTAVTWLMPLPLDGGGIRRSEAWGATLWDLDRFWLWGAPARLSGEGRTLTSNSPIEVEADGNGFAVATWRDRNLPGDGAGEEWHIQGTLVYLAGGQWWPAQVISSSNNGGNLSYGRPAIAADSAGNKAVIWNEYERPPGVEGDHRPIQVNVHDRAGPILSGATVPTSGFVNERLKFSTEGVVDAWSDISSAHWWLDNNVFFDGFSIDHAYPRPGRYTVELTASDELGNGSLARKVVRISDPPSPPPPPPPPPVPLSIKCLSPDAHVGKTVRLTRRKLIKLIKRGFVCEISGPKGASALGASFVKIKTLKGRGKGRFQLCLRVGGRQRPVPCRPTRARGLQLQADRQRKVVVVKYRPSISKRNLRRAARSGKAFCGKYRLSFKVHPAAGAASSPRYFRFFIKAC